MLKIFVLLFGILLYACGPHKTGIIEYTTYPETSYQEVYEEKEFFISQHEAHSADIKRMLENVPQKAKEKCGNMYIVMHTKYYTGEEATSRFLNRTYPWLKVIVRCPIRQRNKSPNVGIDTLEKSLVHLNSNNHIDFHSKYFTVWAETIRKPGIKDSDYFDSHSQIFNYGFEEVWYTISDFLINKGHKILYANDKEGILVTDLKRHGIYGFPYFDAYVVLIQKIDNTTTRINIKLFRYSRLQMLDSRFISPNQLTMMLVPNKRSLVYEATAKFMEEIEDRLAAQKDKSRRIKK